MNLHEYQAKALFSQYGIPVSPGKVIQAPEEAVHAAQELGGHSWVIKAQIHSGGRGKAGGVRRVASFVEIEETARALLGTRLVTGQSIQEGLPVDRLLVEAVQEIRRELYVGALVDRAESRIVLMASRAGGVDIEEVARTQPEAILTTYVHPAAGLQPYQARKLAFGIGLQGDQIKVFGRLLSGLYQLFTQQDASLAEINPLAVTSGDALLVLDAKLNIDDNALFRQPQIAEMRDVAQEDLRESQARAHDLNYISLDGNIGCMVNGAGLAMATMDLVKLKGGKPANFLDVGGSTTAQRVAEAFKLILSDAKVEAILVNIFGGIVRCDLIARGIIQAIGQVHMTVPLVVRLAGTNAEQGRVMLRDSGLDVITAADLSEAAERVVTAVG